MKAKSYVLFALGKSVPTVKHDTLKTARLEAKRLMEIGATSVLVCEVIEGFERVVSTRRMKSNPLPSRD